MRSFRYGFGRRKSGFNPCFAGSASVRSPLVPPRGKTEKFQSLFCWKCLCERSISHRQRRFGGFQSLFCWKCLCELRPQWTQRRSSRFQSLFCWKCLCELTFSWYWYFSPVFQSLFCWKCLCEHQAHLRKVRELGFNPCFAGSASVSRYRDQCA